MGIQEQEEEIEALSFIFPEEFTLVSSKKLEIIVQVQDNSRNHLKILLKVEFPEEYPDVSLLFSLENLNKADASNQVGQKELDLLTDRITEKIQEFLGLAMVFSIVEFIKTEIIDILQEKFANEISTDASDLFVESEKKGTKVSKESFQNWKEALKSEIIKLISEKKELPTSLNDFSQIEKIVLNSCKKITGRQMFERDQSLINTDYSQDTDDDVVVDFTLFKGMDVDLSNEVEGIDLSEDYSEL